MITAATAKGKERGRGSALAVQGRRKQSMAPRGGSRAAGSGMSLVPANVREREFETFTISKKST